MDVVVTVPKTFTHPASPGKVGLAAWVGEGDAAGEPYSGERWVFSCWGPMPPIKPGERVYVVCDGRVRGYAPLIRMGFSGHVGNGRIELIRGGGAVAVTIPGKVVGFRGWKPRWWRREDEVPFPNWRDPHGEPGAAEEPKLGGLFAGT